MNEENERERRKKEPEIIRKRVDQIRKDVRKALKRMKSGKAVPLTYQWKYASAWGKWP